MITVREMRANLFTNSKVHVSMDLHRRSLPGPAVPQDVEEDDSDHEPMEMVYDRGTRTMRDAATGDIVTKHNMDLGGVRMREKIDQLPLSFASGDMRKGTECTVSNKVFKSLKRFSEKQKRQTARGRDSKKDEQSTHALALDAPTRLILYKLVNGGVVDEVNGCLSTGKESVVFHGRYRPNPDAPAQAECALKVFKTTLTEFKNRTAFLQGDRRFEARVGKQGARKLVRLWAEKEMSNLLRMEEEGVPCPHVVRQRKHVLVMSFLGKDGVAAPKLKHVELPAGKWAACYATVVENMTTLFRKCALVHADLSEYNILYFRDVPHFIDVGQSVHTTHPRAREFLFRDCFHVTRFFTSVGVAAKSASALFTAVCGDTVSAEQEVEFMRKVSAAKGRAPREEEGSSSRVCEQMTLVSRANPAVLLDGIDGTDSDDSSGDDAGKGAAAAAADGAAEAADEEEEEEEEDEEDEEEEEEESESEDSFVRVAHADVAAAHDDGNGEDDDAEGARCGGARAHCGGDDGDGVCSDEAADRPE